MVVWMKNAPEKRMYLESWSLVDGVVREDYRTLRRWSLLGGSASLWVGLVALLAHSLCFLCMSGDIIS